MTIDWSKPICLDTVPPREAILLHGPDGDKDYRVQAVFDDAEGLTAFWFKRDGQPSYLSDLPRVRNLTPADLAARDGAPDDIAAKLLATQEQAAELAAALRDAEGELERAREQFAFYAESHRQKQTADGDEKAETNTRFAGYMEACRDNAREALAKWEQSK